MTTYVLNLGFNWYGATVGSVWGSSTGYYFLQNALGDNSNDPEWFTNFKSGDYLAIVIYDLSSSNPWSTGTTPKLTLSLAFSDLTSPTTIHPAKLLSGVSAQQSSINNKYYLQYSPYLTVAPTSSPPWESAQGSTSTTPIALTFHVKSDVQCKLSLLLEVTDPTNSANYKTFVSDTEIIVS